LHDKTRYPSRCFQQHVPIVSAQGGRTLLLRGRIVQLEMEKGILVDETGEMPFVLCGDDSLHCGDIVELLGSLDDDGILVAKEGRLLAASKRDFRQGDWARFHANKGALRENLLFRSRVISAMRDFFSERGFLEVDTPYLTIASGLEVHIDPFTTHYCAANEVVPLYLATSPEHHMKRLLGCGMERIVQFSRCFRNGECTDLHNPEFTMVEWYRAYASYEEIMADCEELVKHLVAALWGGEAPDKLVQMVEAQPWARVEVCQAFKDWAGLDLEQCPDAPAFLRHARSCGFASADQEDSWEDLFNKVLLEKIEPRLAELGAAFLIDYPASLGALAKLKERNEKVAERAELYLFGVELANGYTELNDPQEQRQRFEKARESGAKGPVDEEFLQAMECAIPPAGGTALGVDRLVMLLANCRRLSEVIAFPYA